MWEKICGLINDKRLYRRMNARANALPEEYRFVYKKIQSYMWNFSAGETREMLGMHEELLDMFEAGAAEGRHVLEITGDDVAAFSDELLANAKTYTRKWHESLNREIMRKLGKKEKTV